MALPSQESFPPENLGAALSREARRFRRGTLRAVIGFSILCPLLIWGMEQFADRALLTAPAFVPGLMAALCLMVVVMSVPTNRKQRRRHRHMTARLAREATLPSVGPLVDALCLDDELTREMAKGALIGLLPRLGASDAALLNDSQRATLCHILSLPLENPLYKDIRHLFRPAQRKAVAFRIAILQALEQVGDGRALSIVERLAKEEARTPGEKRIRDEALACLPTLQFRREQARYSQTLLRASRLSAVEPETLLRPATDADRHAQEQLLRPGELLP